MVKRERHGWSRLDTCVATQSTLISNFRYDGFFTLALSFYCLEFVSGPAGWWLKNRSLGWHGLFIPGFGSPCCTFHLPFGHHLTKPTMEPWSRGSDDPGAYMAHFQSSFVDDLPTGVGGASARCPPTDAISTMSSSNITDEDQNPETFTAEPASLYTTGISSPALQEIVAANESL